MDTVIDRSKVLVINEPFWSAGRQFGWPGAPAGLGIRKDLLESDGELLVSVGKSLDVYRIDKSLARDICIKYRAYHTARGVALWVVPWSSFECIFRGPRPEKKRKARKVRPKQEAGRPKMARDVDGHTVPPPLPGQKALF